MNMYIIYITTHKNKTRYMYVMYAQVYSYILHFTTNKSVGETLIPYIHIHIYYLYIRYKYNFYRFKL